MALHPFFPVTILVDHLQKGSVQNVAKDDRVVDSQELEHLSCSRSGFNSHLSHYPEKCLVEAVLSSCKYYLFIR